MNLTSKDERNFDLTESSNHGLNTQFHINDAQAFESIDVQFLIDNALSLIFSDSQGEKPYLTDCTNQNAKHLDFTMNFLQGEIIRNFLLDKDLIDFISRTHENCTFHKKTFNQFLNSEWSALKQKYTFLRPYTLSPNYNRNDLKSTSTSPQPKQIQNGDETDTPEDTPRLSLISRDNTSNEPLVLKRTVMEDSSCNSITHQENLNFSDIFLQDGKKSSIEDKLFISTTQLSTSTLFSHAKCQDNLKKLSNSYDKKRETSMHLENPLKDFIIDQLKSHTLQLPPQVLSPKIESCIKKVFEECGTDCLTFQQFEEHIVVYLLKLGPYISETLYKQLTLKTGKLDYPTLESYWQGRLLLGEDYLDQFESSDTFFTSQVLTNNLLMFDESESQKLSSQTPFQIKPCSVQNFFNIIRKENNDFIEESDLLPFLDELIRRSPSLSAINEEEFCESYKTFIIEWIMYELDKNLTGRIYYKDLKKSLLAFLWCSFDQNTQIHNLRPYFSIRYFNTMYDYFCKLDPDNDQCLKIDDLYNLPRINNDLLNRLAIERIWSQIALPFKSEFPDRMSLKDWLCFWMLYEDTSTQRSLRYWFKIVDLDSDGCIRDHEIQAFWSQQISNMRSYSYDEVDFEDWLCQMNDAIQPGSPGQFYLSDFLKSPKFGALFFNSLISLKSWEQVDVHQEFRIKQSFPDFSALELSFLRDFKARAWNDDEIF